MLHLHWKHGRLSHWTAREVPILPFGKRFYLLSVLCSLTITTAPVVYGYLVGN